MHRREPNIPQRNLAGEGSGRRSDRDGWTDGADRGRPCTGGALPPPLPLSLSLSLRPRLKIPVISSAVERAEGDVRRQLEL
jgi:hypothetical protein